MKHIIFIDNLAQLNIKKDSSLFLALTLKESGKEVYLLFENDLYINTADPFTLVAYDFSASFKEESFYLDRFTVTEEKSITLGQGDVIHMRLDPPFDGRYLRYLWMLQLYLRHGIRVLNDPRGILLHNEKLHGFEYEGLALPSYVGASAKGLSAFLAKAKQTFPHLQELILKPTDLYQGLGVEKFTIDENNLEELLHFFDEKAKKYGVLTVQPFLKEVKQGEVRAIFFNGKEIGSILKVPPEGSFLANIAQGASYRPYALTDHQRQSCEKVCKHLLTHQVPWVAFDIIGPYISEINVTCPGLLVEVSQALGKNLAQLILQEI